MLHNTTHVVTATSDDTSTEAVPHGFEVSCTCGDLSIWSLPEGAAQGAREHVQRHAKKGDTAIIRTGTTDQPIVITYSEFDTPGAGEGTNWVELRFIKAVEESTLTIWLVTDVIESERHGSMTARAYRVYSTRVQPLSHNVTPAPNGLHALWIFADTAEEAEGDAKHLIDVDAWHRIP